MLKGQSLGSISSLVPTIDSPFVGEGATYKVETALRVAIYFLKMFDHVRENILVFGSLRGFHFFRLCSCGDSTTYPH